MIKGLVWIIVCEQDSGNVIISDNGKKAMMPAAHYAVANYNPPIYELPKRERHRTISAGIFPDEPPKH